MLHQHRVIKLFIQIIAQEIRKYVLQVDIC
jgi:hypothetical protein